MKLPTNLKFLKREKSFRKKEYSFNSIFFWRIVVLVAVFFLAASFIFGFFLYRRISKQETNINVGDIKHEYSIDEERVDSVLEFYSRKAGKSSTIIEQPALFTDPSI